MTFDREIILVPMICITLILALSYWRGVLKAEERETHLEQMAELVRAECGPIPQTIGQLH